MIKILDVDSWNSTKYVNFCMSELSASNSYIW